VLGFTRKCAMKYSGGYECSTLSLQSVHLRMRLRRESM